MRRRRFLKQTAMGIGLVGATPQFAMTAGPSARHPLGIIINTVKKEMSADFAGTLQRLRDMGYQQLEGGYYGGSIDAYKRAAQRLGLQTVCGGSSLGNLRDKYDEWMLRAEGLGYEYIVCYYPWLFGNDQISIEESYKTAEDLNDIGRRVQASGFSFAWHAHAWEYAVDEQGETPLDVIMKNTDPSWVTFEMDIYWTVKGGADPISIMDLYEGRIKLLHVKDMADGPSGNIACVGDGVIDYQRILAHADRQGIPYWFVENETDQSNISCAQRSAAHLQKIL